MPWLRYDIDIDTPEHLVRGEQMLKNFLKYAPDIIVVPMHKREPNELNLRSWNEHTHYQYRCLTLEQHRAITALHRKRNMDCLCRELEPK